jgi:hypothetical protein
MTRCFVTLTSDYVRLHGNGLLSACNVNCLLWNTANVDESQEVEQYLPAWIYLKYRNAIGN